MPPSLLQSLMAIGAAAVTSNGKGRCTTWAIHLTLGAGNDPAVKCRRDQIAVWSALYEKESRERTSQAWWQIKKDLMGAWRPGVVDKEGFMELRTPETERLIEPITVSQRSLSLP